MMAIDSPAAIKKLGEDYMYNPVGTGAYVFKEWVPDDKIMLEANPNWWGTDPTIKTLVYRVIQSPPPACSSCRPARWTLPTT